MPGKSYSRVVALTFFLGISLLPYGNAAEQPRSAVQHLRAKTYLRGNDGSHNRRARAMRYTRMAVLRAKCELSKKDKSQCARLMAGTPSRPAGKTAPALPLPPPGSIPGTGQPPANAGVNGK